MHQIATDRKGSCLSKKYINDRTKLKWKCKKGHIWEASPNAVKFGTWCPICAGLMRLTIEEMHQLAASKNGKCLSEKYINSTTKLRWQCEKGHTWFSRPTQIKRGEWCPTCSRKQSAKSRRLGIEMMQELAQERGGVCLSTKYANTKTKLKWICSEGHIWYAKPGHIKNRNQWCPHCSHRARLTLEDMHKTAAEHEGKCLSEIYHNNHTKLLWQCSEGHTWEATPSHIRASKSWCPYCAGRPILTIDDMHEAAQERGGKCLSEIYINIETKLLWECSEGHRWKSSPINIRTGKWCPTCYHESLRLNLEDLQKIASERGGKCLSKVYRRSDQKLLWECSDHHTWEATANHIKNMHSWCPICREHDFERRCRQIIEELLNAPFPSVRPSTLLSPETGFPLEIDCFNEELKIAIEIHGIQHYQWVPYFHPTYEKFQEQQMRDRFTEEGCKKLGFTFVEIPYNRKRGSDLEKLIKTTLTKSGIQIPKSKQPKVVV